LNRAFSFDENHKNMVQVTVDMVFSFHELKRHKQEFGNQISVLLAEYQAADEALETEQVAQKT
jgi:PhoPQ-activated pathogenicity-related protein